MRIAFYAPLKSPAHATPSGDRRVAELLVRALRGGGHSVSIASEFRSLDMDGDATQDTGDKIGHQEFEVTPNAV